MNVLKKLCSEAPEQSRKSLVWVLHNSKKRWNITNSEDPDQTLRSVESDLDLHGLQWHIYPNT